jgi:bifunctional DNA-binding transcriptional regulator/antitoxin component of YhaV-PrlF toxin-antitoxin module
MANKVIDVSHVSARGTSIRITLPKKIVRILDIGMDDIVVFKESEDGSVIIEKMKGE